MGKNYSSIPCRKEDKDTWDMLNKETGISKVKLVEIATPYLLKKLTKQNDK